MRERIIWPFSLWVLITGLDLSILLAIGVALDDREFFTAASVILALTLYFWWRTRLDISIDRDWLRVGRARVEIRYIKAIVSLDEDLMRRERGTALDARAYLALRFWMKTGAKIILEDSKDPTPYWLISTRKADQLKQVFETR
jgi:hypothetical protein